MGNLWVHRDASGQVVGDPNAGPKTVDEWFNTKAFALPAQYTFGNAGAYITNADGIIGIDMALEKKFPIRESHAVEFRTEFFNVPNTVVHSRAG